MHCLKFLKKWKSKYNTYKINKNSPYDFLSLKNPLYANKENFKYSNKTKWIVGTPNL